MNEKKIGRDQEQEESTMARLNKKERQSKERYFLFFLS